jgi:hypothetical protein
MSDKVKEWNPFCRGEAKGKLPIWAGSSCLALTLGSIDEGSLGVCRGGFIGSNDGLQRLLV